MRPRGLTSLIATVAVVASGWCVPARGMVGPLHPRPTTAGDWPMYAGDPTGSRTNRAETALSRARVNLLGVRWRYRAPGGPVYGTPAAVGGRIYDADMLGNVFALDAKNGA